MLFFFDHEPLARRSQCGCSPQLTSFFFFVESVQSVSSVFERYIVLYSFIFPFFDANGACSYIEFKYLYSLYEGASSYPQRGNLTGGGVPPARCKGFTFLH